MPHTFPWRLSYATLAKTSFTVVLLVLLFYQTDFLLTAVPWLETKWSYLIVFGPLVFFSYVFIDVLRWKFILEHQGLRLRFLYLTVIYTRGTFLGAVLPGGTTTGDIYRMYSLAKDTQETKASISSVFLYRISGLCAVLILSLGTFQYSLFVMNKDLFQPFLKPMIVITALLVTMVIGSSLLPRYSVEKIAWLYPFLRKVRFLLDAIPKFFENKTLVLQSLALAVALQLIIVGWSYIVSKSLHISVAFVALVMTVPLINLSALLPISLGGFGVREVGYVFFLVPFGLTPGEAISLSLISVLVQLAMRLISGVFFFYPLPPFGQDTLNIPKPPRLVEPDKF